MKLNKTMKTSQSGGQSKLGEISWVKPLSNLPQSLGNFLNMHGTYRTVIYLFHIPMMSPEMIHNDVVNFNPPRNNGHFMWEK